MVMPGETVGAFTTKCADCGTKLEIKVCRSNAYYIGFECQTCMTPYSRESGYFSSKEEAEQAFAVLLATGVLVNAR